MRYCIFSLTTPLVTNYAYYYMNKRMKKSEVETVIKMLTAQMQELSLYEEHCTKEFLSKFNISDLQTIEYWDILFNRIETAQKILNRRFSKANEALKWAKICKDNNYEETEDPIGSAQGSSKSRP